jgi:flagellar hook-length control protein FliK
MSSAAGLVTGSPLQLALQMPPDAASPLAEGGAFSAALAAACVAEPEAGMPEGMQSAAALAWLAGFVTTTQPATSLPDAALLVDTALLDGSSGTPVLDFKGSEDVSAAALSFLQQMLQPVVPAAPHEEAAVAEFPIGSGDLPAATSAVAVGQVVAQTAQLAPGGAAATAAATVAGAPQAPAVADAATDPFQTVIPSGATVSDSSSTAPLAAPLMVMRALVTDAKPEVEATANGDPRAVTSVLLDSAASSDASLESSVSERLIGALAERVSARTDGAATPADADRNAITGPNLYTNTREAVATTAGQVSTRPEVVHATVGSPRWANELGSRLAMMSVRGQNEGSLTLTPEHLGPLEVRISMNQDRTDVWFGAQNADTRAALADAIPRLREMFAASGLALGHAGVSHDMPGQAARQGEMVAQRAETAPDTVESLPARTARVSTGLLDTWA